MIKIEFRLLLLIKNHCSNQKKQWNNSNKIGEDVRNEEISEISLGETREKLAQDGKLVYKNIDRFERKHRSQYCSTKRG